MTTTAEIVKNNKDYTIASWSVQNAWNPIVMDRAEGVYFWDAEGKRYIDWSSQLVNVNVGHSHPHVIEAIRNQIGKMGYAQPSIATEARGQLGELLAEITPGKITKAFFTNGGTDAIETAIKIARMFTGKQKILTRYRSYHGATFGAASAGGDPRRHGHGPGVPDIVRLPDPYAYRSPVYNGRTQEEGDLIMADMVEEIVQMEDPKSCAAILIEGYSGTSGIIQPTEVYWNRLHQICQKYDMLLIVDEVMSGFGRTGEWFGVDNYPNVQPDIIATAKGITSGYVPLGATIVSEEIANYFNDHMFSMGLTYSAHPLAMAAGVANIEVYRSENLIENSRDMGKVLRRGLNDLAEKHQVIGDIRGTGLHQVIELVKNRETREALSGFQQPFTEPLQIVYKTLRDEGMSTFVRWNMIFNCPPLTITEAQLKEGLDIIDHALTKIDGYYEG
ncbi:MAG: aminotransferase class III-fold pyridoxal phosphate-dependent enzyme [Chloroflexi bacterium]|nr:aminotransferase class III-fold pyridoxal phosphate-dependent enzyme [Chloroflexota bacterium]MCC6895082.1 aminotransferase class III-fold pyridoxal phosphate-dependent enzyme [Anaerolineae bacterium]